MKCKAILSWLSSWVLFATLVSHPVLAAEASRNPHYQAALRLYDAIEYEAALLMLDKAAQWPFNTRADRVSIALLQGVLSIETRQPEHGKTAFRYALSLDPNAKLAFSVSPKVSALLEQIRTALRPPAPPEPAAEANRNALPPKPAPTGTGTPSNISTIQANGISKLKLPIAVGGGVVAVGGAIVWTKSRSIASRIGNADPAILTRERMDDSIRQGKAFEKLGWVLMGLGAATTTGSLLFIDKPVAAPMMSIAPMPEGAYVSAEWSLP